MRRLKQTETLHFWAGFGVGDLTVSNRCDRVEFRVRWRFHLDR